MRGTSAAAAPRTAPWTIRYARTDRLGIACGIEYAAQAMALHGALAAGATGGAPVDTPKVGFLAGVRDVRLWVSRLDDIEADLICDAILVAGDGLAGNL